MSVGFRVPPNLLKALIWLWLAAALYVSFAFLPTIAWAWTSFSELPWWRQMIGWVFVTSPALGLLGFCILGVRQRSSLNPELALLAGCLSQVAALILTVLIP